MPILLFASLFFVHPDPIEMPRAEAYLVEEDGRNRLEDRYNRTDLWIARALLGRWSDDDGRVFSLFRLDMKPPAVDAEGTVTRSDYESELVRVNRKRDSLFPLVDLLSPVDVLEEGRSARQIPHAFASVEYWQQPTNLTAIVCTFRIEKNPTIFLATWELAEGDDFYVQMDVFEKKFLDVLLKNRVLPERIAALFRAGRPESAPYHQPREQRATNERELMRRDVRHGVALYPEWHVTSAPEFEVIDDLPGRGFIAALTNDLRVLRVRYAETIPTDIDGSNALCVARIYRNRDEYLAAIDEKMAWTAAYWCPARRELVAHLPQGGEAELMRTIRHEAFHQYLSYALSMIPCSPWLNEGYAQYFEDGPNADWGLGNVSLEDIDRFATRLPGLLGFDYEQFYAGDETVRRFNYRLAWSVAVFLEQGAPEVRFTPFKNVKRDYVAALLRTRDMRKATAAAFKNQDALTLFVREWKRYWKNR